MAPEYFRNIADRFPVFQSRRVGIGAYFTKFGIDGNLGSFSSESKITYRLQAGISISPQPLVYLIARNDEYGSIKYRRLVIIGKCSSFL